MDITGALNPIEKGSRRYLERYLPHYLPLRTTIEEQLEEARRAGTRRAVAFWNGVNRFIYMIFENLSFLHLQLAQKPTVTKNSFNVYQHLPQFMATLLMAFPVSEYMRRLICMLSLEKFAIDKNQFTKIVTRPKREKEFKEVEDFLRLAKTYPYCTEIESLWNKFSQANDLRHLYTHGFRLPWWPRQNTTIFGFPKTITSESRKIKDEIWEFVTDANRWQGKVSHLDKSNFVSGADLIEEVHRQGTVLADILFRSLIEHIKRETS
jgi:hypothetical protein